MSLCTDRVTNVCRHPGSLWQTHDVSLHWQVGLRSAWLKLVYSTLVVWTMYICTLHIYIFWSNGPIYICTSNGPEVVDLVMDRMCGDESRHAVRTLYSDLIDDNEIRHPNHCCWSILLSLLNVMAIMEFSSASVACTAPIYEGPLLCEGGRANGQGEPSLCLQSCDWGI